MSAKYDHSTPKNKRAPCKRCAERRERIARAVKNFTRKFRKGSK